MFDCNRENSFEDQVPVDEFEGSPMFKWTEVAWLKRYGINIVVPAK